MSEDLVRVLRVVEYIGPRSAVEKAVSLSVHGERRFGPRGAEITVRAATIGEYPEILERVHVAPADLPECSFCGAEPGSPCRGLSGLELRVPHVGRLERGRRKGHFLIIGALESAAIGCLSNPTRWDMDFAEQENPGCMFREVDVLDCPVCAGGSPSKVYATGWDDGQGSIGMCDGPTPNLDELLDRQPPTDDLDTESRTAYIYEFEGPGSNVKTLYAWIDGGWEPL